MQTKNRIDVLTPTELYLYLSVPPLPPVPPSGVQGVMACFPLEYFIIKKKAWGCFASPLHYPLAPKGVIRLMGARSPTVHYPLAPAALPFGLLYPQRG